MSEQCNDDVYKYGESVGFVDMTKQDAEAHCQNLTAETDYTYDWHYVGGRVHIKRLRKGFVKEDRYVLIKRKDLGHLTPEERVALGAMLDKIAKGRESEGRKPFVQAVVIENDWACYDDAWKMVMAEWAFEQEHKSTTLKPSE